ncbi:MAG: hypothetical protein V1661_01630 [bacterium]
MNKKTKIILLSAIILSTIGLLTAGVSAYLYFRPFNVIKEKGFSFKYPKGLDIKKDGPSQYTGYIEYLIRTKIIYGRLPQESSIIVNIPTKDRTKNEGVELTLSNILKANNIKSENYLTPIKEITIDGHKGEMVEYRLDRQLPGDIPVHSIFSEVYLNSSYANAPIMLEYINQDSDPDSLNTAWEMILKTLKF